MKTQNKKRILTGDTPTGKLHLGHYVGTLENRIKLQKDYETFIILADLHSFTTLLDQPERIRQSTFDVALDNLAVGIDPEITSIFIESQIPEIYELAAMFSMLVSHNTALRNPTIKDEIKMKGLGDKFSLGFVNYPIYQAADILCVKANLVPVGVDQLPHLEQTREIARKFNELYGETFPIIEGLVGRIGKLVGIDGNPKMGKSLGNCIYLSDDAKTVETMVMKMYTDPKRVHSTDPGNPEGNPVFMYHETFNPDKKEVEELKQKYREGKISDVEIKKRLVEVLNAFLEPIRKRRTEYSSDQKRLEKILKQGTEKTRDIAQQTLQETRRAMKNGYFD